MKKLLSIALCAIMFLSITGCSSKEEQACQNILDEFQYACNEKDIDAMLRCIEPETSSNIELAIAFAGMLTDMDKDEMMEYIENYLIGDSGSSDVEAKDLFSTLEMEVTKFETEGNYAVAYVNMNFEVLEVEMTRYGVFELVKVDGTWYIQSLWFESSPTV